VEARGVEPLSASNPRDESTCVVEAQIPAVISATTNVARRGVSKCFAGWERHTLPGG